MTNLIIGDNGDNDVAKRIHSALEEQRDIENRDAVRFFKQKFRFLDDGRMNDRIERISGILIGEGAFRKKLPVYRAVRHDVMAKARPDRLRQPFDHVAGDDIGINDFCVKTLSQ